MRRSRSSRCSSCRRNRPRHRSGGSGSWSAWSVLLGGVGEGGAELVDEAGDDFLCAGSAVQGGVRFPLTGERLDGGEAGAEGADLGDEGVFVQCLAQAADVVLVGVVAAVLAVMADAGAHLFSRASVIWSSHSTTAWSRASSSRRSHR